MVRLRVSSTDHTDTTSHRIRQDPINLLVGDEFHFHTDVLENGVPSELWRCDILSRMEFVVAHLYHQQLWFVLEYRAGINIVFGWLQAHYGKGLELISQDENITLNRERMVV